MTFPYYLEDSSYSTLLRKPFLHNLLITKQNLSALHHQNYYCNKANKHMYIYIYIYTIYICTWMFICSLFFFAKSVYSNLFLPNCYYIKVYFYINIKSSSNPQKNPKCIKMGQKSFANSKKVDNLYPSNHRIMRMGPA